DGTDLRGLSDREMCDMRGDRLAMIFQEPMTSLNPVYSIGEQIAETLVRHRGLSRKKARARTRDPAPLGTPPAPAPRARPSHRPRNASTSIRTRFPAAWASGQ